MKYEINDNFLGELDMTKKLYERRNPIAQCCHYNKHIEAMTSEGLYCKSDIAAELAHRDIIIEDLFGIYWQLLGVIEANTDPNKDVLDKLLVESAYNVLNKHKLSQYTPRWDKTPN